MTHASRHSLEDLLGREITAAQGLVEVLAAERTALTGDSPDAVMQKAAEKLQLLNSIEEMEGERRSLWGTPDEPTAPNGDSARLGGLVADRWHALMALIASCRAANEVNGHIIHIRQNQTRQLFDIVRGSAPVTYGPQGKTFTRTLRALARA